MNLQYLIIVLVIVLGDHASGLTTTHSILTGDGHPIQIKSVDPKLNLRACRLALSSQYQMQLQNLHPILRRKFTGKGTAFTASLPILLSPSGASVRRDDFQLVRALILGGPELTEQLPETVRESLAYLRLHADLSDFHIVIGGPGAEVLESIAPLTYAHRAQREFFLRSHPEDNDLLVAESLSMLEGSNRVSNSLILDGSLFDNHSAVETAMLAIALARVADIKKLQAAARNDALPDFLKPQRVDGVLSVSRSHLELALEMRAQMQLLHALTHLNLPQDIILAQAQNMYSKIANMFDGSVTSPVTEHNLLVPEAQRFNEDTMADYFWLIDTWFEDADRFH